MMNLLNNFSNSRYWQPFLVFWFLVNLFALVVTGLNSWAFGLGVMTSVLIGELVEG